MTTRGSAALTAATAGLLALGLAGPVLGTDDRFEPGAPGVGDPYFPTDGNGGYDVDHYDLALRYDPERQRLDAVATITARATQGLSRFDLDLRGLQVTSVEVDGAPARFRRDEQELRITPAAGLPRGSEFEVEVAYGGRPKQIRSNGMIDGGFMVTDDGFTVAGQPESANRWFPVNDHPVDAASYTFRVTVPEGRSVVANGELVDRTVADGWETFTWEASDPMASYLATVGVGDWEIESYAVDGLAYLDAIDPVLIRPAEPSTGTQLALSQPAKEGAHHKRLSRTIDVPADGATLAFDVTRDTEPYEQFVFVEARTAGGSDWTTLEDLNGHTGRATGYACWMEFVPEHYVSKRRGGGCLPRGRTGEWWAASGDSDGRERWEVDLGRFAGSTAQVAITVASPTGSARPGVFVDDVVVSTGEGTTSFEDGADGWVVPGAPAGAWPNENDWIIGTVGDLPPTAGEIARRALRHQPAIVDFLADTFGPYPWTQVGGIVDDTDHMRFALETQTRPVYSKAFFTSVRSGDSVIVHELAHQWFGDSVRLKRWRDIWLNEGAATYAQWLWDDHAGHRPAQASFDRYYRLWRAADPFWDVRVADPGRGLLFSAPVYYRGAMALHALRLEVGDRDFFRILRTWTADRSGRTATTTQLRAHAERISGERLGGLFRTWLRTKGRPAHPDGGPARPLALAVAPGRIVLPHGPAS